MKHWGFPYGIDARGRTKGATEERHVVELIEQVLFTAKGERVNRPDFGSGLQQLVFAPNSPELASAVQYMVQGALQQHLGHRIRVSEVLVAAENEVLRVTVRYALHNGDELRVATFEKVL